jgi:hypothetical protein
VPWNLTRYYGNNELHFITCSCYRRQRLLGTARRRDLFLKVLEQVREKYQFVVIGYVVMPEHFHLLISEPQERTPSTVMQGFETRLRAAGPDPDASAPQPLTNPNCSRALRSTSGRSVSTISTSGRAVSASKNYAISTITYSRADW